MLTGGAYLHLYFIFVLVQFILLSDLFCAAMHRHPACTMVLSAAVTFAMQGLIACAVNGYLTFYSTLPPAR